MEHMSTLPFIPPAIWHRFLPSGHKFVKAVEICNRTCREIIERRQRERASSRCARARILARDDQRRGSPTQASPLGLHLVSNPPVYGDFLEIVLDARDENGQPLSDKDILDNVNTFVFAGQYVGILLNCGSSGGVFLTRLQFARAPACWAAATPRPPRCRGPCTGPVCGHSPWVEQSLTHGAPQPHPRTRRYELALRPRLQDRIVEEAQEVLGDTDADGAFEYDQLKQLKFLEMVMKEVRGRSELASPPSCRP